MNKCIGEVEKILQENKINYSLRKNTKGDTIIYYKSKNSDKSGEGFSNLTFFEDGGIGFGEKVFKSYKDYLIFVNEYIKNNANQRFGEIISEEKYKRNWSKYILDNIKKDKIIFKRCYYNGDIVDIIYNNLFLNK